MKLPEGNPRPREGINASESSGLGEFFALAFGLIVAAVVLAAILAFAGSWLAPLIPFRWEQSVVGSFPANSISQYPRAEAELQQLADELAAHEGLPKGMTVHVHLIGRTRPNAFATLGGQIFVTRGLLKRISSENALAMVLAHEIGHVKHRDPIRSLSSGAIFGLLWAVLLGSSGQSAMTQLFGSAGLMTRLKFTRGMEAAADQTALAALRRVYGSDCGAGEFFRKPQEVGDQPEWSVFMRTHPLTQDRLVMIGKANAEHPPVRLRALPPAIAKLSNASKEPPMGCTHRELETGRSLKE